MQFLFFNRRGGAADHPASSGAAGDALAGLFCLVTVPYLVETFFFQRPQHELGAVAGQDPPEWIDKKYVRPNLA